MAQGKWFRPDEKDRAFISEHWGKWRVPDIAKALGVSTDTLSSYARQNMDLPCLVGMTQVSVLVQTHWTPEEDEIIAHGIDEGLTDAAIRKKLTHRSASAVRWRRRCIQKLRAVGPEVVESDRAKMKHSMAPRAMKLKPVEWTRDDYVPVTFAEACHWMKQQKRHWRPTGNHRSDWLAINTERIFGKISLPPFILDKRRVVSDLVEWHAEAV